jgi:AcrR family transcriptional regulator
MDDQFCQTRKKIILAASALFGSKGHAGTSIREIALQADVNIAAINYHFQSKANLFLEVFRYQFHVLALGIQEIAKELDYSTSADQVIVEFIQHTFSFYLQKKEAMYLTLKVILTEDVSFPKEELQAIFGECGPPGGTELMKILKTAYPAATNEWSLWAVRTLLSLTCHMAMIHNSQTLAEKIKESLSLGEMPPEESLKHTTLAILQSLKKT